MTKKLYYEDVYMKQFSAVVKNITTFRKKAAIVLDQTAFFPEGGGQTSDIGFINHIRITDVQIEAGIIYHLTEDETDITIGTNVDCKIDWDKRFSDMQNHSGEHIFSGLIHKELGLDNKGFHLGTDSVTLDFGRILTADELENIEFKVNEAIWQNKKINCFFPTLSELPEIEYRSKKEIQDDLRLVEIEDIDICACCAPHVSRTGEIGIVKVIGTEKIRGGTRISILCGQRAFNDIKVKIKQNKKISVALSEKEYETSEAVNRLKKERDSLNFELIDSKRLHIRSLADKYDYKNHIVQHTEYTGDFLRYFANELLSKVNDYVFVYSGDKDNYHFVLLGNNNYPVTELLNQMRNTGLNIKGGGKNNIIQGTIFSSAERIELFFGK